MAIPTDESEYSTILRISGAKSKENGAAVQVPSVQGYEFVSLLAPRDARVYSRDMTLARGRILYDVWDFWLDKHLGHLVPCEVFAETKSATFEALYNCNTASHNIRQMLGIVQSAMLHHFPRLPIWSRPITAEEGMLQSRGQQITRAKIEEVVVDHALHFFTSYSFRRKHRRQTKHEALNAVEARLRSVLRSWLPIETSDHQLMHFYARNAIECPKDRDTTPTLFYYGGAETVANLASPLGGSSWS